MGKDIKLTLCSSLAGSGDICEDPDGIDHFVITDENSTMVYFKDKEKEPIVVKGTPEDIRRLIKEAKEQS